MIREKKAVTWSGGFMLVALVVVFVLAFIFMLSAARSGAVLPLIGWLVVMAATGISFAGLFVVNPNEAKVAILFGNYVGSVKDPGFHWINPFTVRKRLSLRVRNFESGKLKVNDHAGNPIEIAAIVVWKVVETAEAMFEVDDYQHFVTVQSESALRNLATSYPYDAHKDGEKALRSHTNEIAEEIKREIQDRLAKAGVEVIEARISHLAYAPEIASAMLRRQQASAIVAARAQIVEGAVGMVEMALEELSRKQVIVLDEERKATMVSNLLVVLCGDRDPQPVVNAGTLYQ
jgi:regulator of protease activity HflC (stomatin/prohibitin superfamily)